MMIHGTHGTNYYMGIVRTETSDIEARLRLTIRETRGTWPSESWVCVSVSGMACVCVRCGSSGRFQRVVFVCERNRCNRNDGGMRGIWEFFLWVVVGAVSVYSSSRKSDKKDIHINCVCTFRNCRPKYI